MPELPEVETVVRGLQRCVHGQKIDRVEVYRERTIAPCSVDEFVAFMNGRSIEKVERFGKYIHFRLDGGRSLVSHLRMTGKFVFHEANLLQKEEPRYLRVLFYFESGGMLAFQDARVFGTLHIYQPGEVLVEKEKIGLDALSPILTGSWLYQKIKKRRLAIKQLLLDQRLIAGIGNIYAAEALFYAGIDPFMISNELTIEQIEVLVAAIKMVLRKALKYNGSSIRDFKNVDEKSGAFQNMLMVYGRAGQPCRRCGTDVLIQKQGQRSTFFCPECQQSRME